MKFQAREYTLPVEVGLEGKSASGLLWISCDPGFSLVLTIQEHPSITVQSNTFSNALIELLESVRVAMTIRIANRLPTNGRLCEWIETYWSEGEDLLGCRLEVIDNGHTLFDVVGREEIEYLVNKAIGQGLIGQCCLNCAYQLDIRGGATDTRHHLRCIRNLEPDDLIRFDVDYESSSERVDLVSVSAFHWCPNFALHHVWREPRAISHTEAEKEMATLWYMRSSKEIPELRNSRTLDQGFTLIESGFESWPLEKTLAALRLLHYAASEKGKTVAISCLDSQDEDCVVLACRTVGRIGGFEPLPKLFNLIESRSSSIRAAAAEALGNLGSPESIELLSRLLHSDGPEVRGEAAEALGKIGGDLAYEHLRSALELESHPVVRAKIQSVINRIQQASSP